MQANKTYIGDSVYAEYNGFEIILTTENGGAPSNRIVLEPAVYDSLVQWVKYVSGEKS